jgi:hypothetical protein
MKIHDISLSLDDALGLLPAKCVLVYASVLTLLTHILILALYIHVPSFRESPGADFVQFYTAALLSGAEPDKVYDSQSQMEIQRQFSMGARNGVYWPYLHAPFFTVLLIPLRWFSYVGAFWLWTLFTLILYLLSLVLLIRSAPIRRPPLKLRLAVAGAAPVLYWLILTGQTTAIALFIWSLGFVFLQRGRFYWSGFILGFLTYRAQYLSVILPLLFLRRMWSGIFGFSTSFLLLIVLGGLMFSFDAYWQYIEAVRQQSGRIENLTQPLSHYVTVYGFFRQLLPPLWALCGSALASSILVYWLWKVWRGVVQFRSGFFELQYASLVTTTLLLMYHGFVYDLLLLTIPMLLLYQYRSLLPPYHIVVLLFLYFVPYMLLIFRGQFLVNPIQPALMFMCFEIYLVSKKITTDGSRLQYERFISSGIPPDLKKKVRSSNSR